LWIIHEGHIVDFADDFISADSSLLMFMIYKLVENDRWIECIFLMQTYSLDPRSLKVPQEFLEYWDSVRYHYHEASKIDWVPPTDENESYLEFDGVLLLVDNEKNFKLARVSSSSFK
jgi:hypothetical protein